MTTRFLPWLKSYRGAQTGLSPLVVGILLASAPHFAVAIDVSVAVAGEVRVAGTATSPPIVFSHFDEIPAFTMVSDPYQNSLRVSEDLDTNSIEDQVSATIELSSSSVANGAVHKLSSNAFIHSFEDPSFDNATAEANVFMTKLVTLDQDYRYAFSWMRSGQRSGNARQIGEGSAFQLPGAIHNVGGFDVLDGIFRFSGVAHSGDELQMTSIMIIVGGATPLPDFFYDITDEMSLRLLPPSAGTTQQSALHPETVVPGLNWLFDNFPSGLWFDPPATSELTFVMISDTLFDRILDFPTGLDMPVTVSAEGQTLGAFGPGDELDFVALLGHGVSSFEVSGISPPAVTGATPGFSLQLAFNEPTADFRILAVPEPPSLVLCCAAALLVAFRGLPWAAGRGWRAPNSARR